LAEGFVQAGVPVFAADIKGDVAGQARLCRALQRHRARLPAGPVHHGILGRIRRRGPPDPRHHLGNGAAAALAPPAAQRQAGRCAQYRVRVADEQGLALLDLKDIRAILSFVADNAAELQKEYGNVLAATVGTIQRQLLILENQDATSFFGEPALDIHDFMRTNRDAAGSSIFSPPTS
jgi:DNA double-strand break repair helicase HerA and related ATPase